MTKKLILINPRNFRFTGLNVSRTNRIPPLSLGIIAALTPDDWDVEIIDENFSPFKYKDADLIGLTADTATATRAYEIASEYRVNGVHTVMGGIHASMLKDEALRYVATVVSGEAESVWTDVISDFESGEIKPFYEGERVELEGFPFPRHDLFRRHFFGIVQTSRGCPSDCEFCSVTRFNGGSYRQRPVEEVLDEIETIPQRILFFADDNLIPKGYEARAINLFEGMIRRKIKKQWWCQASLDFSQNEEVLELAARSGCKMVFMGIEAEDEEALLEMGKKPNIRAGTQTYSEVFENIHKHGITILGAFMFGFDSDTREKLRSRTDYILNCTVDSVQATVLTPLPGTRLFEKLERENRLLYTEFPGDWDRYNVTEVVYEPFQMTEEELWAEMSNCWRTVLNRPEIAKRALRSILLTGKIASGIWGFGVNSKYRKLAFSLCRWERAFEGP